MSFEDIFRAEDATSKAEVMVELIRPLFAGEPPEIVGAVLGQLLAILVAGHCPEMREQVMKMVIDMARDLVPVEIEIMIEAGACDADWRGTKQ